MAEYEMLVMVNARDGQDDALNAWLDRTHIPEVLKTPGFKSCRRYELAGEDAPNPAQKHRYMHMYRVETDDLNKTREVMRAAAANHSPRSPALDPENIVVSFYRLR